MRLPQPLASGIDSVYSVKLRQKVIKKSINMVLKKFPIMGTALVAEDLCSPAGGFQTHLHGSSSWQVAE